MFPRTSSVSGCVWESPVASYTATLAPNVGLDTAREAEWELVRRMEEVMAAYREDAAVTRRGMEALLGQVEREALQRQAASVERVVTASGTESPRPRTTPEKPAAGVPLIPRPRAALRLVEGAAPGPGTSAVTTAGDPISIPPVPAPGRAVQRAAPVPAPRLAVRPALPVPAPRRMVQPASPVAPVSAAPVPSAPVPPAPVPASVERPLPVAPVPAAPVPSAPVPSAPVPASGERPLPVAPVPAAPGPAAPVPSAPGPASVERPRCLRPLFRRPLDLQPLSPQPLVLRRWRGRCLRPLFRQALFLWPPAGGPWSAERPTPAGPGGLGPVAGATSPTWPASGETQWVGWRPLLVCEGGGVGQAG